MNNLPLIVFDFETGNVNIDEIQPIQVAAVVYDIKTLQPYPEGKFCSMMKPWDMSKVEDSALKVNKKTREEIEMAPPIDLVWKKFVNFVQSYNKNANKSWFNAPIPCGHNIIGFDLPIIEKLCEKYGPFDKKDKKQNLFNRRLTIDTLHYLWTWLHNTEIENYKQDTILSYGGKSIDGGHDALIDCLNIGEVLMRFLKFQRNLINKNNFFKDCFKDA